MLRRDFIQLMTVAGVGGLAALDLEAASTNGHRTSTFQVKGFSCITCAVGLDTLLQQQKGVVSSKSTYPEGKVTVSYNSHLISESAIRGFIAEMGFTVESEHNED